VVSPRNILVGYDGSDCAGRALERAAGLAGYDSVVTVVSPDAGLLAEARELLLNRHVPALYSAPPGELAETLLDKACELEADLVVVGGASRNGAMGAKMVDDAPCDVLVVR
jgi:nucleotide-binding universal stress UspA family protein